MRISAPRNGFDPARPVDPSAVLGEQLGTYLIAAKGAFSENTERAIRADVDIFCGLVRKNGSDRAARAHRHRCGVHRRHGAHPGAGHGAPLRLQHRHRAQGRRADKPARKRPRETGASAHAPAERAAPVPGAGPDLAAAPAAAGGLRRPAHRRQKPRAAGRGVRLIVTPLGAGGAASL